MYTPGQSGLLIQSGIGWRPDTEPDAKPGYVVSVNDSDYVADITRLIEERDLWERRARCWHWIACIIAAMLRLPTTPAGEIVRDAERKFKVSSTIPLVVR